MRKLLRVLPAAALALSLPAAASYGQQYTQTNLVSSTGTSGDTDLVNPWGMSRGSGTPWWLADAGTGLSTLYMGDGTKITGLVVKVPGASAGSKGAPTGTIYNGNSKIFLIPGKSPAAAAFLFCTAEGTISGWNNSAGTSAVIVAKGKKGQLYT
jgi:hypothetical protein